MKGVSKKMVSPEYLESFESKFNRVLTFLSRISEDLAYLAQREREREKHEPAQDFSGLFPTKHESPNVRYHLTGELDNQTRYGFGRPAEAYFPSSDQAALDRFTALSNP